ncbi:hypothetical protein [Vibrio phage BONAISHI]|nr:hypothetical protein [Vibrio phage BONAISHI]
MYDTIGLYDGLIKPADLEAIVKAETLFQNTGYHHHEYPLLEVLAIKDFENDEKASQTYNIYYEHVDTAIMLFGVKLHRNQDVENTLVEMVEILDALLSLDDPDQAEVINESISNEVSDPIMILALILSEFTELQTMKLVTMMESVDDSLINALKKIVVNPDLHEDILMETARIRKDYLTFIGDVKEGPVYDYVKNVQELPVPFDIAMMGIGEQIQQVYDPATVAYELYSLSILSGLEKDAIVEKAMAVAWELDSDRYAEIEMHLRKRHEEFMAHE